MGVRKRKNGNCGFGDFGFYVCRFFNEKRNAMRKINVKRVLHGFTLIELLVVVAIIAVLVAILLPALNRARESARKLICMTNQRALGLAVRFYVDDNNGTFFNSYPSYNYWHWWNYKIIHGYLPHASGSSESDWGKFSYCPAADALGMGNASTSGGYRYSWIGFNLLLHGGQRESTITRPSETLMLADSVHWSDPDFGVWRLYWRIGVWECGVPHARHMGAVNVAWVDGHCSSVASPDPADITAIYRVLTYENFVP